MPTPVTVDAGAIGGAGSGATGWSANDMFDVHDGAMIRHSTGTTETQFDFGRTTQERMGQSFTPANSGEVDYIDIRISNEAATADDAIIEIQTSAAGPKPSGTVLGSGTFPSSAWDNTSHDTLRFIFPTPIAVTGGVKYWVTFRRSGTLSATDYYRTFVSNGNLYTGHGTSVYNSGAWSNEHATTDLQVIVHMNTSRAIYKVTQDTKLHMWKSTNNGASWTEQDAGNGPTVNSSTKPFSCCEDGGTILCGYFNGTNQANAREFLCYSDVWRTADVSANANNTDISFNRPIRVLMDLEKQLLVYSSLADGTDIENIRYTLSGWSTQNTVSSGTHADDSSLMDGTTNLYGNQEVFYNTYYQSATSDVNIISQNAGNTLGSEQALDTTAADAIAEHTCAVFTPYDFPANTTITIAFSDVDGHLQERTALLEALTSSVSLGTQNEVVASTSYAGRSVSTCKFGSDRFIFACTGSAIHFFKDTGDNGSWDTSDTSWLTGLTNAVVQSAVPITGVGILVSYTDNGDSKVVLYSTSTPKSDTDSLGVTLSETDAVAGAIADTEALGVTLTENNGVVAAALPDSDSLAVTLTENNGVVTAAIFDTDSLAITLTESESVSKLTAKSDTDTLAITLTETDAVSGAIADVESLAVTLTENNGALAAAIADTESLAVTLTENNGALAAAIADTEALGITLTETETLAAAIADVESLAVTLTEVDSVSAIMADSDSLAVTLTETNGTVAGAIADADSLGITLAESEVVSRQMFRTDTDSLAITLAETDSVAGAIADSDSLGITLAETDAVSAAIADTESLGITLAETDAVSAALADVDSLAITLTESEQVAKALSKTDTDSLAITLTESESIAAAISDTETLSIALTESDAVTAAAQDIETLAIELVEQDAVSAVITDADSLDVTLFEDEEVDKVAGETPIADSDSLAVTLTETDAVAASAVDTDSLGITLSETDLVSAVLSDSDSLGVTLTETDSVAATAIDVDSLAIDTSEIDVVTAQIFDTDSLDITLTESEDVTASILKSDTDTLAITLTENETIERSIAKLDTDTLAITLTESDSVSAAISDAEALGITLAETDVVSAALVDADALGITLAETDSVAASISDVETLVITLAESETLLKHRSIFDTDTLAVTLTESETVARQMFRTDSDSLAITLTESDALGASIQDVDTLDILFAEIDVVSGIIFDSDALDIALTLAELVLTGVQRPKPVAGTWREGNVLHGAWTVGDGNGAAWEELSEYKTLWKLPVGPKV